MEAYFDNSATTGVLDSVKGIMIETMTEDCGNAAAKHSRGMVAENYIKQARTEIVKTLRVWDREILFISDGTKSNNVALIGMAFGDERVEKHITSSNIEYAPVHNPLGMLADHGYEITYLSVDEKGHISLRELGEAIHPDTLLVSVIHVNNEIGAVEPVKEISKMIKQKDPRIIFHVDAAQARGKYTIHPKGQRIDLSSTSGRKIYGPKGVGFLYIDEEVKVKLLILGDDRQKGMCFGTENAPGMAGPGVAAKEMYTSHEGKLDCSHGLKDYMIDRMAKVEGTHINGEQGRLSTPQMASVSFDGTRNKVLLHALEGKNIYVSLGSACPSNHPGVSDTLRAIGMKKELLDATLRFSFGPLNTKEEIDYSIEVLKELPPVFRRYKRG